MKISAQRATTDVLRWRCGPRCKCPLADKRATVEEMHARGASVAGVAQRDGVNANLLCGWDARHLRRQPCQVPGFLFWFAGCLPRGSLFGTGSFGANVCAKVCSFSSARLVVERRQLGRIRRRRCSGSRSGYDRGRYCRCFRSRHRLCRRRRVTRGSRRRHAAHSRVLPTHRIRTGCGERRHGHGLRR